MIILNKNDNKKRKPGKGDYGYVKYKKKSQIILTIVLFILSFAVLISAYFISGKTKVNIGTVLAVVMVLPACKALVGVILIFPHNTIQKRDYEKIKALDSKAIFIYDLVLTSDQKPMGVDCAAIGDDKVVMYSTWHKEENAYVQKYFQKVMESYGFNANVTVTDDLKKFMRIADSIEETTKEAKDIKDTILVFGF